MATASVEEYLEAIYKISESKKTIKSIELAHQLGISAPSVAEMTNKMADQGLITKSAKKGIELSKEGKKLALQMIRRHRLSERLLSDILGLSWDVVHEQACKFEHVISPEVESAIERILNNPEICPHGYPIPDINGNVKYLKSRPLSELKQGDKSVIMHVKEDNEDILKYFTELNIVPGTEIAIDKIEPFGGTVYVTLNGNQEILGKEIAALIFVA